MKIAPKIIVPVLLAILCAGALIVFLWWQLTTSTQLLQGQKYNESDIFGMTQNTTADPVYATDDVSLIHLRQGDLFALRGEWSNAQHEYDLAVQAGGGLPALRKLAQAQMQRRDIKGVNATVKKMRSAGAKEEDILLVETIIKLRTGELVQAKKSLESAEDSPQKHYGLALLAIVQGNHDETKKELDLTQEGWDPILRSYAQTLQSAYDEFSLFPEGSDAHRITLLSRALAQVQECELALPLLVQVTNAKDDYRDAWIVQGYCELVTEREEQSLASLEHAYSLDPQKPEIQYFLARAYSALNEYQNAITFFQYALSNGFEPQEEVRRLIAKNALEIGNAGLALDQYDALTESDSATLDMFDGYISAALSLGKTQEAYVKATKAVERWPEDAQAYEMLSNVALALGQKEEAKKALQKVIDINPKNESAKQKLQSL